jgi:hypothetical protein
MLLRGEQPLVRRMCFAISRCCQHTLPSTYTARSNNPRDPPPPNPFSPFLLGLLNLILALLQTTTLTQFPPLQSPLGRIIPILTIAHLRNQVALAVLDEMLAGFRTFINKLPQAIGFLQSKSQILQRADGLLLFLAVEEEEFAGFFRFVRWEGEV